MKRLFLRWLPVLVALVAYDVYLLGYRLAEVQGNVEAQFIIITPGLLVSHLVNRHRQDKQHDERMAAHDANATELAAHRQEMAVHREDMAAVVAQVADLHRLHIHGTWPEDKHQGR